MTFGGGALDRGGSFYTSLMSSLSPQPHLSSSFSCPHIPFSTISLSHSPGKGSRWDHTSVETVNQRGKKRPRMEESDKPKISLMLGVFARGGREGGKKGEEWGREGHAFPCTPVPPQQGPEQCHDSDPAPATALCGKEKEKHLLGLLGTEPGPHTSIRAELQPLGLPAPHPTSPT